MLADINENALRAATEELTAAGHRTISVTCNVADETQAAAMVERTVATFFHDQCMRIKRQMAEVTIRYNCYKDYSLGLRERRWGSAERIGSHALRIARPILSKSRQPEVWRDDGCI